MDCYIIANDDMPKKVVAELCDALQWAAQVSAEDNCTLYVYHVRCGAVPSSWCHKFVNGEEV